jgi:outer membrane receptor protein involved in Fe transport
MRRVLLRRNDVKIQSTRARLLASTMICGAALTALTATPSFAQEPAPPAPATPAPAPAPEAGTAVREVVVTGSRIRQPNLTTTSPVTTINSQDVRLQGGTRVEDVVNQLPQAFAAQGSTVSNASTGTATVNLRGLGAERTLVLIDGRRLVPGDPVVPTPDLNNIPNALVDRIDVVTGGASAVYGSDAVAGVVNFIMKKNLEGVQIDANYGFYQHNNDNDTIQDLIRFRASTNPSQFKLPPDNVTGGYQRDVTVAFGANSPDGKGNVEGYLGWRDVSSVLQSRYDYSACALGGSDTVAPAPGFRVNCSGSSTAFPGRFITGGGGGPSFTLDPVTGAWRPYNGTTDAYNFAPLNYFQRPDTRYTGGFFSHYEVNRGLDLYSQFMFMDDRTVAQIAPSGIFLQTMQVNCDNPFLNAAQVNDICGPTVDQDGDPTNGVQACTDADAGTPGIQCNANVAIGRRNVEGGGRQDDLHHTSYRLVFGARGDIGDNWHYDAYGQFGQTNLAENYQRDFSLVRSQRALLVVSDPRTTIGGQPNFGQPICQSVLDNTDPNCVPYNIFQLGGVTPEALNYLQVPGFQEAVTQERVVSASMDGRLADYGVISPWAKDGVSVAFGFEYRRESLDYRTDLEFTSGDLAGQGGPRIGVAGTFDVREVFVETRVPVLQDMPYAQDLSFDLGYRHSDYSSSAGNTNTYKVEGNWTPINDIRLRASYNRAVRAPNINELFTPQAVLLDGSTDPCAGTTPAFTAAQCAFTGVSAGQYGNILENPAAQYNGLLGGNPDLKPETSDTYAVGLVLQPRFLPGFNATIDWFDIKVEDFISNIGADTIITVCGETGDPTLCSLINRAPGTGSLWLGTNGFITDITQNTGELRTKGIDLQANYRLNFSTFGWDDWGRLDFNFVGTWLDEFHVKPLATSNFGSFDCEGKYGPQCGNYSGAPLPEWRHKLRATWTTPWKGVQISGQWRYLSSVDFEAGPQGEIDDELGSRNYFDLSGTWRVWDRTTLRAGVNNIFDKDPPIILSGHLNTGPLNGNTAPGTYDALGRYFFFSLTQNF